MRTTDLTSSTLAALRTRRTYPAVTVTLPTHRRETDNAQDSTRLRRLVAEAKHRLEDDPQVPRDARFDISGRLDKAVAELDLRHCLDGLVIFAAAGEHQVWSLPWSVPERVVFSDTYLTRNLVSARERVRPYWVLAVAVDRTTLWSGSENTLREERTADFPAEPEPRDNVDPEREERIGDAPSAYDDERTRHYMRQVNSAVETLLATDPRPLYLMGVAPALSLLEETGGAAKAAVAKIVKGGLTNGPAPVLAEAVAPALAEQAKRDTERAIGRVEQAQGRKAFAAGLNEVWQTVKEGRIDLLVVEENYAQTVRVAEEHLLPVAEGETTGGGVQSVREDIVDEIVEAALETGSEVAFVPDDTLAAHERIVAALRF
ncbi:chemotaxis protein [Streptomyces sp. SAJ15]|uniref:baeRF3 domain-containing protein n=1 Tax=Streptomyces sp. SAJ15 TaxID=2011095 RepID=UPI001184FC25|nr:chemotaxis protein [Streptomyces sp. SAJ15]TVL93430.1 chemotaxis protein [Streptomyces sp. SAJ15]